MTHFIIHAPWIVPGEEAPIADGALVLDVRGTVLDVGPAASVIPAHAGIAVERVHAIVTPALVNAHTHVELSALRGRVPGGDGFVPWVARLVAARRAMDPDELAGAIDRAVDELDAAGTAAIGDVGNDAQAALPLARRGMQGWFFHEVVGIPRENGEANFARAAEQLADVSPMRAAMVPHALYSVDAALIDRIARFTRARHGLLSVHLAESAAERAFLRDHGGPLGTALARAGLALEGVALGEDPVAAAGSVSLLAADVLAAHLADARRPELDRLAAASVRAVLCPRSNLFIQTLLPPLLDILAAGLRPALGTDSLASNTSLDVLAEAAALRARFSSVSPRTLFAMATAWGADSLDLPLLGRFRAGARPGVLAFDLPAGTPAPTDPLASLLAWRSPARRWLVRAGDPTRS